jgi:hypothetical protein
MPDIFISYRREDASGYAGRLYDQISAHFGEDHVFMDVADIEPGSDFTETIHKKVGTCDALIALIGKNWLTARDEQDHLRLGGPEDFVSIEIAAALARNVEVIPVLVAGAKMPLKRELPESLQLLSHRQAVEISDAHFNRDVADLVDALKKPAGARVVRRGWIKRAVVISFLVAAAGAGIGVWQSSPNPPKRLEASQPAAVSTPRTEPALSPEPPRAGRRAEGTGINGNWKAVLRKGSTTFDVYFTFEEVGDKLFGKVVYPTGEAGILNGQIGHGTLSFITRHVPNFEEQEATITVAGKISDGGIELVLQDKDGFAKGIAQRVNRTGQPKARRP